MGIHGCNGKILMVDDSIASIDMVHTALENEGYEVIVATSGEKALRLVEMTSPDLILLDVIMPDMDGFETCRRLKTREKTRDIPVIFMTGLSSTENKVEGFEAGGVDYVTKPLEIEVVLSRIKTHLALCAAHAELKTQNERLRNEITERKRAEETVRDLNANLERLCEARTAELAKANQHLKNEIAEREQAQDIFNRLFLNAPIGIYIVQKNIIKMVNPGFQKVTGFCQEEIIGKESTSFVLPEFKVLVRQHAIQMLKAQRSEPFEFQAFNKAGEARWLRAIVTPIQYNNQTAVLGYFFDITTRKQTEEELSKSEERFKVLYEDNPSMYFTLDAHGTVLSVNSFGAGQLGYTVQDLVGKSVLKVFHPDNKQAVQCQLAECLKMPGKVHYWEVRKIHSDGSVMWVREAARTIHDAYEKPVILVVCENITERKLAEEALKAEKTFVDNALDAMSDAFLVIGLNGRLVRWNKIVTYFSGHSDEEIASMTFTDFIDGTDLQRAKNAFQSVIEKGRSSLEAVVVSKEGKKMPFEFTGTLLLETDGSPSNVCIVGRDVSERKGLEEQLRQAVKMEAIGILAGGVAHDFNNLMSAVLGYSDLLLMRLPDDSPLRRDLTQIRMAGERAASLTAQLLAFSRKHVVQPAIVDLNQAVANTEKLLQRLIGEDIDLVFKSEAKLGRIMADPTLIDQVIMNLAINSRDAMPHGGKLTIETTNVFLDKTFIQQHIGVEPGHYVMLAISDSGCGMDQKTLSHIFEPFFTTKGQGQGTGLGLATVYGIVKQSGGFIRVYSEPGQGTTFKIYYPRAEMDTETVIPDLEPEEALQKGTETILLVEDDESVRETARSILVNNGYTVLEAAGGEEALELCRTHGDSINMLIADVVMPEISGPELARRMVAFCPATKVLYMSGYTDTHIVHHGVLKEGVAFLQKPFTLKSLALKVRKVLDERNGKAKTG